MNIKETDFLDAVDKNLLYRFNNELKECKNDEEKTIVLNIIKWLNSPNTSKKKANTEKKKYFDILQNSQYKKKWQYLTTEQKKNRIEEYSIRNNISLDVKNKLHDNISKSKIFNYNKLSGVLDGVSILS